MTNARTLRVLWTFSFMAILVVLCTSASGSIVREWWLDVQGTSVNDLTSDPRYPYSPDGRELLSAFEGPVNWGNDYGSRLWGWLLPQESGEYTFWIASDDCSELRLSIDENPTHSRVIASVNGWTSPREWTKYDTQKSEPIALQAGYKYYIEAQMKESGGGDNIAVAWQPPAGIQQVIHGRFVDDVGPLRALTPQPADGSVCTNTSASLSWSPGGHATSHNIYFSTDLDSVAQRNTNVLVATTDDPLVSVGLPGSAFPTGLQMGTTYYWCVDEVNDAEPDSPWMGEVWSFTIPSEPAVYLLITNEQLAPAFERLVQRRTEQGFPGRLLTVEKIYSIYAGVDGPEKIRNCIIDHFVRYETEYVTLGGDQKIVPVRYCDPNSSGYEMPADLYYADMDGSDWDLNRNGTYGEVNEVTEVELTAEVHLGRIPLRTSEDAAAYINKIVKYEMASPDGFANSMIFFGNGGIRTGSSRGGAGCFKHHDPISRAELYQMLTYYAVIQPYWQALPLDFLWYSYSSWDTEVCGDYDLTRDHLIERLNEGYHFAFNWSHGLPTEWYVTQARFKSKHALALTNTIPGIVFSFSCSSAHFDDESICLSEAFIQNPLGGAIAYFGHTRLAGDGFAYGDQLFHAMARSTDRTTGEIITGVLTTLAAKVTSAPGHQYNYTLHGDSCIQLLAEESGRNLQLFLPKGCEIIERGSDFFIRWNAAGTGFSRDEKVRLEYSPDSGRTWGTIPGASYLPYNGMYFLWKNCPLPYGSNYRIRVVSLSDPSVSDMSGRDFTIGDLAILTVQSSPIDAVLISLSGSKTDHFSEPTDFNITILKGASVSLSASVVAGDSSEFAFVRWRDESGTTITTTQDCTFIIKQDKTIVAEYSGP